jgi:biotin carboxylase
MRRALNEYRIGGIKTSIPFHQEIMDSTAGVYLGHLRHQAASCLEARRRLETVAPSPLLSRREGRGHEWSKQ